MCCCPNKVKAVIALVVTLAALILSSLCIDQMLGGNPYYAIPLAALLIIMGSMCLWIWIFEYKGEQGPIIPV